MSIPRASEQIAGEKATGATGHRPAPHGARMHAWAGVDCLRLEAARVVLGERALRATGSLVNVPQKGDQAYSASYSLATDEAGVMRRLTVRIAAVTGEHHVTVTRSEEGIWLVDHGRGAVRTSFDGALDVDLAFSPLFNALPIRRLGLHRSAAQHDLPVVFVALPSLQVCRVSQTYRTVSLNTVSLNAASLDMTSLDMTSLDTAAVVGISSDSWEAELTVDADGLVRDYPGLARRV